MTRIHTDHNGVAVNAISKLSSGEDVAGHLYMILSGPKVTELEFQRGGVADNGVNGITNEALLAVVIDRINFLNAKFPCRENALAVTKVQEALHWLEARTKARISRGVEGKETA
jgi:hypothetical protein